ncbi:putative glucosyltransferase [Gordonia hirsuta DSM 44140 = NBRC 16056]|uniref:Putative glucosyltransferase n=1 Tax=Gordonia hirsuta DSM 44140 = NBRC 16056 TaxID=1121927 RepID=L7L4V2_9ACTN|nr:glycosyltransferase family 4 protein [Gordonia hirsuta]GAC56175.1 putative glucosyltransferase [Gordonia hirsuta DSM 44140 = NBRC 16056]
MRVLMVSWEYPPVVVGGLGRHVHQLAEALAGQGVDVTVLTRRPLGTDPASHPTTDTVVNGVRVIAVAEDPPEFDFGADMMAWTLAMGHGLVREGLRLLRGGSDPWEPEVVHAHDWLVAHPSIALADFFDVPLVATLHATEAGRHSGWVAGQVNRQVHSVEWWLANTADALITCSTSMRAEVSELFFPGDGATPITVIHNGIDLTAWEFAERPPAHGPAELLFAGRLEYEKGVQDLLAALPEIRRTHPGTTLTIAGEGTQLDWLTGLVDEHELAEAVTFAGRQDHDGLTTLMHRCAAIVLPSRYEPFGIVALEAAASGIPLVTSTAGGLGEAVDHGETGSTFPPADVAALTAAVARTLDDPEAAAVRARRARAVLTEDFTWPVVAERTAAVYALATRRDRRPLARPHIPQRPLPHRDPNNPIQDDSAG